MADARRRREAVLTWLRGKAASRVATEAGVSMGTLARWRKEYLRSKLPHLSIEVSGRVKAPVLVRRDTWGIAHVKAESELDAFYGLGYVMAQERLWQLDYQRRLARGELAEVLGPDQIASDRAMRILGIGAAGDRAWETASDDVRSVLEAFTAGINAWIATVGDRLPVEFEILDYRPRPWRPADSIAIWKHRWWLLTGRLETIVIAEAARRLLPPDLLAAFLSRELADETIVPDEGRDVSDVSSTSLAPGSSHAEGSNNWVVGGERTTTGKPVLCGDPHNQFSAPSQWVEAQLTCPEFDAAGAFYVGTPALYLGRNRHVAWGLTNHTASVRDLYVEEPRPDAPNEYRDGDTWRPFVVERQSIAVAGAPSEEVEIRRTVRGPIVNELLPPLKDLGLSGDSDQDSPPISLRWYGTEAESGFDSSLGLLRAKSADDALAALRQWPCPPLNFVYAADDGRFGYQVAGRVPRRKNGGLFFRRANDPDDAWDGFVPFDELPHESDPPRGWTATANNVPWNRDPWYLSIGNWADGYRARRIRERLSAKDRYRPEEIAAIHADVHSVQARDLVPVLLRIIDDGAPATPNGSASQMTTAIGYLRSWNYEYTLESVGASVWTMFWLTWREAVAGMRFPEALVPHAANAIGAVARRLLVGPPLAWFVHGTVEERVRQAFATAVRRLIEAAGPDVSEWRWGRLHQVEHPHPMGRLPGLRRLYNVGPYPTTGGPTVRAAGFLASKPFACVSGSTYRFMADLSRPNRMQSIQTCGQSAHLGSTHYRDQARLWLDDEYHPFWMAEADVLAHLEGETRIYPARE